MKRTIFLISWLILVSILAGVVWYSPIAFKGYSFSNIMGNAVLARNISQTGFFGSEDKLNITLASSLVKERAEFSPSGGKLSAIIYSRIFNLFGQPRADHLIFVTISILILSLILFSLTVYFLFDLKTAAVFSLIYIFFPFNWYHPTSVIGAYDVPILIMSFFTFLFFTSYFRHFRGSYAGFILSGFFLALAGIAKETFFMVAPALLLYLLWEKKWKVIAYAFIPFFLLVSIFWLPDFVQGKNIYLDLFRQHSSSAESQFVAWDNFSHLYPDPYTYHFAREEHLSSISSNLINPNEEFLSRIGASKVMTNMGESGMSFGQRLVVGSTLLARHLGRFLSFQEIGGPFVLLLIVIGFISLKKQNKSLLSFFVVLLCFSFIFLSYIVLGVRNHLIDFNWILVLLATLGLFFLAQSLFESFKFRGQRTKVFILSGLVILLIYNLILSNHTVFSRIYDQPYHLTLLTYADRIKQNDIKDEEVIAVNVGQYQIESLNYMADKSMVIFSPATIKKLLNDDQLNKAFKGYGIKYILGYSPELTVEVVDKTKVKSLGDSSIAPESPKMSKTKSWLMNLLK